MKIPRGSTSLLVLVSSALALSAAEGTLVLLDLYRLPEYAPTTRRADLYEAFEPYGYRLHPGLSTTYDYPRENPRTLGIHANSDGFRDVLEVRGADERPRIQILGDSFVFGEGVEAEERFSDVLRRLLPDHRINNLGMTGWGPDLMLRALESVGLEAEPDLVILCIYTDDFRRVRPYFAGVGFKIPRYRLENGDLVTVPYPAPPFWQRLRLFEGFRRLRWDGSRSMWHLNEAIFDRFVELSKLHEFQLVTVFLPGRRDTPTDQERRGWLADLAEDRGVLLKDLSDAVHSRPRSELFIEGNWHLNASGHALVGEEIHRMLLEERLISPSGP